jgi:hypothetical protein
MRQLPLQALLERLERPPVDRPQSVGTEPQSLRLELGVPQAAIAADLSVVAVGTETDGSLRGRCRRR